ncbi:Ankyrin repeat and SOCS box protein 16 [Mactra antiquata]
MEMIDIEPTVEYKLQRLKWSLEHDDVNAVSESIQEVGALLNDTNVRALLPQLLCEAYSKQKIDAVLLLLNILQEDIAELKSDQRSWFQKIFCSAVESGQTTLVKRMADLGADVNAYSFGKPLLHTAASNGHEVVVTELIEEGADVNLVDKKGEHVLHSVLKSQLNHKLSVTRLLLSYGANPLVESTSGKLPLHIAVTTSPEVLELFLQDGQDVNITDSVNKDTPLHIACGMCCHDAIVKLLQFGARMNLENKHGETPLAKLLKFTHKANDFHSKTRIKLAKLLISIGFRMKESGTSLSRKVSSHKGRDKTLDRYKEIMLQCNEVPTLLNLSRGVVRESLSSGVHVSKQIDTLDIPSNLKPFLLCKELY